MNKLAYNQPLSGIHATARVDLRPNDALGRMAETGAGLMHVFWHPDGYLHSKPSRARLGPRQIRRRKPQLPPHHHRPTAAAPPSTLRWPGVSVTVADQPFDQRSPWHYSRITTREVAVHWAIPLTTGGDHTLSLPICAVAGHHPNPRPSLALFDADVDARGIGIRTRHPPSFARGE